MLYATWNPIGFYLEPKRFLEPKKVILWGQPNYPFGTLFFSSPPAPILLQALFSFPIFPPPHPLVYPLPLFVGLFNPYWSASETDKAVDP